MAKKTSWKDITAVLLLTSVFLTTYGRELGTRPATDDRIKLAKKPPVLLKLNLQPGDQYLFSSVIKQNIVQDVMGQQMTTKQDMQGDYLYDIQSVENGITAIKVTFQTIKMDTDIGGMQRLTYDSTNPDSGNSELKAISKLIGRSFLMQVNEEGGIEKIEGLSEIIGTTDTGQGELLKQSFGDSSMIQSMSQIINIYPNKDVNAGDTWIKTFSGPVAGMMLGESTSNFSLSEVKGNSALLTTDGQMKFSKLEGGSGNPMLQAATFNLNGTQKGTLEVDIPSGLPIQTTLKQDIKGNLEIQGMQIPMSITSDISIAGKKL